MSFLATLAIAAAIHLLPRAGVPLQSDLTWVYRLQVADPSVVGSVPEGLAVFAAHPMGPLDACAAYYDAFGRWNCVDQIIFGVLARLAGDDADHWRLAFVLFDAATIALFVVVCRRWRVPSGMIAFLAGGLMLAPLEVWTEYTSSEVKASFFLFAAIALASLGGRAQVGAAVAMILSVLSKEPYLAAWPVVLAAAYVREGRRGLLPHGAAIGAVALLLVGLRYRPPRADYASSIAGAFPSLLSWLRDYEAALLPGLARGPVAFGAFVLGGGTVAAALYRDIAIRQRVRAILVGERALLIVAAVVVSIALHGAIYYATRRSIAESRYVLPANELFAVALALVASALWRGLDEPWRTRVLLATASGLVLGYAFQRRLDEAFLLGALLMGVVLVAAIAAARVRRRALARPAVLIALLLLLIVGPLDADMADAANARLDQESWLSLEEAVRLSAPADGHVRLVFLEPNMIETAWGLEAWTLLHGRHDLTYHLEILDTSLFAVGSGGLVRDYVAAFDSGRDPLPADPRRVLEVRADRAGHGRDTDERTRGPAALALLARSPADLWQDRYVRGHHAYLQYVLVGPR